MSQAALKIPENTFENAENGDRSGSARGRVGRAARPLGNANPVRSKRRDKETQIRIACESLAYLLPRVAGRFARRLPSHVELDDLVGAGGLGLVAAVRQHVDKPAEDLKRLAEQRIRGAILDYLRSVDHLTRRQRAAVTAFNRAKMSLAQDGANTDVQRVAQRMGVSVERAEHIQNHLAVVQVTSLDDTEQVKHHGPDPSQEASVSEVKAGLIGALSRLPQRLQTVLGLYYCESLTYKEIGEIMGISRSRICQLHTQAIDELRKHLVVEAA